jgi:Tfp pilus assembly protein PilV
MKSRSLQNPIRRRGTIVQEAVVAVGLVTVIMVGVVQLVAAAAQQRRVSDQRAWALREASNAMEQMMAVPWEDVTTESAAKIRPSEFCRQVLPDPRLEIQVTSADDANDGRKIVVQLDWQITAGKRGEPVQLTAWRYSMRTQAERE